MQHRRARLDRPAERCGARRDTQRTGLEDHLAQWNHAGLGQSKCALPAVHRGGRLGIPVLIVRERRSEAERLQIRLQLCHVGAIGHALLQASPGRHGAGHEHDGECAVQRVQHVAGLDEQADLGKLCHDAGGLLRLRLRDVELSARDRDRLLCAVQLARAWVEQCVEGCLGRSDLCSSGLQLCCRLCWVSREERVQGRLRCLRRAHRSRQVGERRRARSGGERVERGLRGLVCRLSRPEVRLGLRDRRARGECCQLCLR